MSDTLEAEAEVEVIEPEPVPDIDFRRNYAQIVPPCNGAIYEQNGIFYDQKGKAMETGKDGLPVFREVEPEPETEAMSASELLKKLDDLMPHAMKREARRILGDDMPGDKKGIRQALQHYAREESGHAARPGSKAAKAAPAQNPSRSTSPPAGPGSDADLAKWGRGEINLPDPVVFKAIREVYKGIRVSTPRDALLHLIKVGVVHKGNAREDVKL